VSQKKSHHQVTVVTLSNDKRSAKLFTWLNLKDVFYFQFYFEHHNDVTNFVY